LFGTRADSKRFKSVEENQRLDNADSALLIVLAPCYADQRLKQRLKRFESLTLQGELIDL
jgi:hypothetical protein